MKRSTFLFIVFLLSAGIIPCNANGLTEMSAKEAVVTFKLDVPTEGRAIPAVYVKGELSGIAPGSVSIPLEKDGVAVEIGLPRLKQVPLYSLVLGPSEFDKQEADIIVSNIYVGKPAKGNIWSGVFLKPNTHIKTKIAREEDGGYLINLPSDPYRKIGAFWKEEKIAPQSATWISDIPHENNQSAIGGVDHLTYNMTDHKVEYLTEMKDPYWSGAGTFNIAMGLGVPVVHYHILSQPPEATVINEEGPQGLTSVDLDLGKTHDSFIVLQKDGYVDCPSTKCKETKLTTGTSLECILKKKK